MRCDRTTHNNEEMENKQVYKANCRRQNRWPKRAITQKVLLEEEHMGLNWNEHMCPSNYGSRPRAIRQYCCQLYEGLKLFSDVVNLIDSKIKEVGCTMLINQKIQSEERNVSNRRYNITNCLSLLLTEADPP